ncbi:MAG: PLP-dependent aminotransferase family protein [Sedimentisphaerales bacterium]|nr:PLP-dependent aminotransferase family protein [Sedimentisphaerales bacterium]
MRNLFADRMAKTHKSFIREILKVTQDDKVISFAGGLPNPKLFPVKEFADACQKVLLQDGENVLQYSTTEGYLPLREYIAERYFINKGLQASPDEILITNGSQQGLDLVGKVFLNKGDRIIIERPGYLGAIQAFGIFEPEFVPIPLLEDGMDIDLLEKALKANQTKLFHTVINFQNPSGVTYSQQKREKLADIIKNYNMVLVEDNPYGELRFMGEDLPSMKSYVPERTVVLGSFSKVVTPGLRLGWICAGRDVMEKIIVAKQSSDLHSNYLSQRAVYQYLIDNNLDEHISSIRKVYKKQRDLMVSMIEKHFPQKIRCTKPEGGMFLWVTLPEKVSSLDLFKLATKENVAFVPGKAFYVDGGGENTLRLNFSNSDEKKIEEGIKRLTKVIKRMLV